MLRPQFPLLCLCALFGLACDVASAVRLSRFRLPGRMLVLLTHSNTDKAYAHNLDFFIRHGMTHNENNERDYVIVIQETEEEFQSRKGTLPVLPKYAQYIFHKNSCFDWGTFGWALERLKIQMRGYKYFVFMNSSVRGPFLPAYWPAEWHWSQIFISRLNSRVKLVGSTVSCEGVPKDFLQNMTERRNPHIQSYIMATDQEGLQILLRAQHIFECHKDLRHAIYHAELGSARAIFQAGYTIDSLMLRYQGIDWADTDNWNCNEGLNPYADQYYDGTSLNPTEVIFIKFKEYLLDAGWSSVRTAAAYSYWTDHQGQPKAISRNRKSVDILSPRLGRMLEMVLRGNGCFDFSYFIDQNPHFPADFTHEQLWDDFVRKGQFRGDKFRFTCQNQLKDEDLVQKIMQHILDYQRSHFKAYIE